MTLLAVVTVVQVVAVMMVVKIVTKKTISIENSFHTKKYVTKKKCWLITFSPKSFFHQKISPNKIGLLNPKTQCADT